MRHLRPLPLARCFEDFAGGLKKLRVSPAIQTSARSTPLNHPFTRVILTTSSIFRKLRITLARWTRFSTCRVKFMLV